MANQVYANGREVSCKSGAGKSVAAFPDVCFTPPTTPATPPGVPLPYPNTGMTSDTTSGSKTVSISGKEVMLKNKSYFSKSSGDEAGSAPKKGVLTSVNRGKVYFNAWSMDVKIEGENAVRHMDITTHNHASFPGNSPTWPFLDEQAFDGKGPCAGIANDVAAECLETKKERGSTEETYKMVVPKRKSIEYIEEPEDVDRKPSIEAMCAKPKCKKALKCVLSPYSPSNCCPQPQPSPPKTTPHHVVPKSQFKEPGKEGEAIQKKYDPAKAPCICVEGEGHSDGKHGEIHSKTNTATRDANGVDPGKAIPPHKRWSLGEAEAVGAQAVEDVTKGECPAECVQAQLRSGHEQQGLKENARIRPTTAGGEDGGDEDADYE